MQSSFPVTGTIRQSEQSSGFWLISLQITAELQPAELIGQPLLLEGCAQPLFLFSSQAAAQGTQLQLLSDQPFSEQQLSEAKQLHCQQCSAPSACQLPKADSNLLLLGSGLPIANLFAVAKLRQQNASGQTLALLHADNGFPFAVKPARFMMHDMPAEAIGASTLLEDWHIGNRLASESLLPGCFHGDLAEFFTAWTEQQTGDQAWQVMVFAPPETKKKCLQLCQDFSWLEPTGICVSED